MRLLRAAVAEAVSPFGEDGSLQERFPVLGKFRLMFAHRQRAEQFLDNQASHKWQKAAAARKEYLETKALAMALRQSADNLEKGTEKSQEPYREYQRAVAAFEPDMAKILSSDLPHAHALEQCLETAEKAYDCFSPDFMKQRLPGLLSNLGDSWWSSIMLRC